MFAEPTYAQYSGDQHFQHIKVNLQENLMRSLLVSFFASSIRKTIPQEQWAHYLISSQNMEYASIVVACRYSSANVHMSISYVRDDIGLTNKFVAYVYLVDDKCRIRWAGCADPQPGEIQALQACTGQLLKRVGK